MGLPRVLVSGASHWHAPLYRAALAGFADAVWVEGADAAALSRALRSVEPAVAFVLDPHDAMHDAALAVIEHGVPLVLEKPGGLTVGHLRRLRDRAAPASVPITVPFVHRDAPWVPWLRRIERPRALALGYIAGPPSRYPRADSAWMLEPDRAGGGVLVNLGPHFVDLALRVLGEPIVRVRAEFSAFSGLPIEDRAALHLETASGRVADIEVGYLFPETPAQRHVDIRLAGEDGFLAVGHDGAVRLSTASGDETGIVDVDSDPLFAPFVRRAVGSASDGFPGLPTIDDLISAMEVIRAAYRQSDSTTGVPWAT